ncbi:MAG: cellulase family glycosylhydrolase [Phocaeicola sp.]
MNKIKLIARAQFRVALLALSLCLIGCSDRTVEDPVVEEEVEEPSEKPDPDPYPDVNVTLELNVVGRYLKDAAGNVVNLHGFAQTYSPYFNNSAWSNYDVNGCLTFNKRMINEMLAAGWRMNFVRMHLDPYWSDDTSLESVRYEGHERFSQFRFEKYLEELFIPMAEYAISKGLYVVMRPPGVAPHKIAVGDDYQAFLTRVWDIVSKHPKLKNNGKVMIELANEPIDILGEDGTYGGSGDTYFKQANRFFQPIVDKIRSNGAKNIIWVPGLGYQSQFAGFASYPIVGENIGYAVHAYPGWYGSDAEEPSAELGGVMGGGYEGFQRGWDAQVMPVANLAPIMVTEMDWAPAKYESSWGKSITGVIGGIGFGANFKYIADNTGNVSWLLFTDCHKLAQFKEEPGSVGNYNFLNDPEACPWPIYHWYKEYAGEGEVSTAALVSLSVEGISTNRLTLLTGATKYLVVKATYADGTSQVVTSNATVTSSNSEVVAVGVGQLIAHKDGVATITIGYAPEGGEAKQLSLEVNATTFPLTKELFNPSIWEKGSFDETTQTLVTGQYGFGGWEYNPAVGVNLSGYSYLVAQLGADNDSDISFRLFNQGYWDGAVENPFGNNRKVVVDLHKMTKLVNGTPVAVSPTKITIVGFWSKGGKPIVIERVYLTNSVE